jgi:ribosomal-protein-alanine N-acetyltransferase
MLRLGVVSGQGLLRSFFQIFLRASKYRSFIAFRVEAPSRSKIENVQFKVRDYHPEDFNTLWAIDQSCFDPEIAYSRYELQVYLRRPGAFTLIADLDGQGLQARKNGPLSKEVASSQSSILAFVVAESSPRGMGHIITIDVRPAIRRHHVGSALLNAAEHRLRTAKCHAVRLETAVDNASAISFYKRHGYDVIKVIPHYYSTGVDALLLEKNLLSVESSS